MIGESVSHLISVLVLMIILRRRKSQKPVLLVQPTDTVLNNNYSSPSVGP